jgi:hypothetical protein
MLVLVAFAVRVVQCCVAGAWTTRLLGADPKHPVVKAVRAVAEPFLAAARPIAGKLPLPEEWAATAIVLFVLDLLRRLVGA